MIFTDGKKCFVDKEFRITEELNNAFAFVNVLPSTEVELLFLTPIANNLNRYEAIEVIKQKGEELGYEASLPTCESCYLLNYATNENPFIKDCHVEISNSKELRTGSNCFVKVNSLGQIKTADTKEILGNVYLSIKRPLIEFIKLNPSSYYPKDYMMTWYKNFQH